VALQGIVEAKTLAGVGAKLYHLKNRNPKLAEILEEQKDETGIVTWRVR
jgi:hypothetical protein